jgi:hypothetical protein
VEWLPDNPFVPIVLACVLTAVAFSLLAFLIKSDFVASAAPPALFLIGYYATYQKVPPFPPIGSTNKIFYIALLATLGGFVLDRIAVGPLPRAAASLVVSLLAAAWIAYARLDSPDAELIVTGGAVILVGALVLWRVGMIATAAEPEGGGAAALALLAALAAVFAPVALFGGSSTSVGLCLGFAIGLGICSLSLMLAPRSLGSMAVLGAGGGLLAVIDTVVLITGGVDLIALALVALSPLLGPFGVRLLPRTLRGSSALVWVATGIAALSPLPVIVTLLFLRYENPLAH